MIGLINDLPKDKEGPRVMLKIALRLKLALALKTAEAAQVAYCKKSFY